MNQRKGGGRGAAPVSLAGTIAAVALLMISAGCFEWSEILPGGRSPESRLGHTALYIPGGAGIILFGGMVDCEFTDERGFLSLLPGSVQWIEFNDSGEPPTPRAFHSAVYDVAGNRMIVFGGKGDRGYLKDVHALDFNQDPPVWERLRPAGFGPSPRCQHTAVYDPAGNRMIVFGGKGPLGLRDDLFALDLTLGEERWSSLHPLGAAPEARHGHSAVHDRINRQMVLFGGFIDSAYTSEIWGLSLVPAGLRWTRIDASVDRQPAPRTLHSAVYMETLGYPAMVVYGGEFESGARYAETYLLDLSFGSERWTLFFDAEFNPPALSAHSATFDERGLQIVVFGGVTGVGPSPAVYTLADVRRKPTAPNAALAAFFAGQRTYEGGDCGCWIASTPGRGAPSVAEIIAQVVLFILPWMVAHIGLHRSRCRKNRIKS